MTEKALAEEFEDATWMNQQPNPDITLIGLYALSERVREKSFRVIKMVCPTYILSNVPPPPPP